MTTPPANPPQWPRTVERAVGVTFKRVPEDFRVAEHLAFEPSGAGEHLFVQLEKRGIGTPELARLLADAHGIDHQDVGYAGMKDKQAVASQWFSLRGVRDLDETVGELDGVRVLRVSRHGQKLRRGQLAGNSFAITLRDPASGDIPAAMATLTGRGAPNYFGGQRFGRGNLQRATSWLGRRRRVRTSAFRQGLHLSVLRSFLFNEVLAARVRAGSWCEAIAGDVPDGRGVPTGPLWGRGRSAATEAAAAIERSALAPHAPLLDGLEHAGLSQSRRALVLLPEEFRWQQQRGCLEVSFSLGPGGYATSLLGDLFELNPGERCPGQQSCAEYPVVARPPGAEERGG